MKIPQLCDYNPFVIHLMNIDYKHLGSVCRGWLQVRDVIRAPLHGYRPGPRWDTVLLLSLYISLLSLEHLVELIACHLSSGYLASADAPTAI